MNNAAATALTIGVVLVVPASAPGAFAHPLTSSPRHHHALRRRARRSEVVTIASAGPAPAWTPFQGAFVNPFATPPRPLEWPKITPYPPGQGDTDGMSRDVDDCNKGCIDGPY